MSELPVPRSLPGWRPLLAAVLILVGVAIALVFLLHHSGPSVSPGLSDANRRGLYEMDVDGAHKRLLIADFQGQWPSYLPDGRVLFLGASANGPIGTLFSTYQGGQSVAYAAAGPANALWTPDPRRPLAWSPDHRFLLAVTEQTDASSSDQASTQTQTLYLVARRGGELRLLRPLAREKGIRSYSNDGFVGLSWSRAGAVYLTVRDGGGVVWRLAHPERPGGQPERLLGNILAIGSVSLSPDGRRLAYVGQPLSGSAPYPSSQYVSVVDLATQQARVIGKPAVSYNYYTGNSAPAWSPDGRRLAWSAQGSDRGTHVYVADLASGQVKQLTASSLVDGSETEPAFSPDGQHLVYVATRGYDNGDVSPFPLP